MLALVFLLLALPVMAADPVAAKKLQQTQEELKASEKRYQEYQKKQQEAEEELKEVQDRVMVLAQEARSREDALASLEADQTRLEKQITLARDGLRESREEITGMVAALIRLAQVPGEALIAMPGQMRTNLQAASVLRIMTRELRHATRKLTAKLEKLDADQQSLVVRKEEFAQEQEKVVSVQDALAEELEARQKTYSRFDTRQKEEKQTISKLTRQSRDLQDLIGRLEAERKARERTKLLAKPAVTPVIAVPAKPIERVEKQKVTPQIQPEKLKKFASFDAARGRLAFPVAGSVTEWFGQKLGQNRTSKGITLASRTGNSVVAPYGGEVVFTGPFLDYGQMVILRYEGGYHLLIAGLSEINCRTGQSVTVGEPVGRVGSQRNGKLYLELRYQGRPVNPAPWFG